MIYSSETDPVREHMTAELSEAFPDYEIVMEYIPTGQQAARLLGEGTDTECDITQELTYVYLQQLDEAGMLADLSDIVDFSKYIDAVNESTHYSVVERLSGAIILNTEMMDKLGLPEPTCYEDLLDPQYEGLVVMADPKSSGTGYCFLKSLVNAWGEDEAFDYFEKLSKNIVQYTSGGSGVTNCVMQQEAAVGLGITALTAEQITAGEPLKILFFEEGSPNILYGQAIIEGKQDRQCVRDVFQYLNDEMWPYIAETHSTMGIFTDDVYGVPENVPEDIQFSDMSGDTLEEQERLLDMWTITG